MTENRPIIAQDDPADAETSSSPGPTDPWAQGLLLELGAPPDEEVQLAVGARPLSDGMVGTPFAHLVATDHQAEAGESLKEAVRTRRSRLQREIVCALPGERNPVVCQEVRLIWYDADGAVTRMQSHLEPLPSASPQSSKPVPERDVEALTRALRATRREFVRAAEAAKVGVWWWEPGADALHWGPGCRALLTAHGGPLPASHDEFLALFMPHDRDRLGEILAALGREEITRAREDLRFRDRDGNLRYYEVQIEASTRRQGEREFFFGLLRDVSAVRYQEHAIQEARERAESANRAKSEFLAMVSHEIRTPLNAILGFADLLRSAELGEAEGEYADSINAGGEMLLGLIDDILDYATLDSGLGAELQPQLMSIEKELRTVTRLYTTRAHEKSLGLHVRLDPSVPALVRADPKRVRQVFQNLVDNAVKFTARGFVSVTLTAEELPLENRYVLSLAVSDTGPGIAYERRDAIFRAFSQGDSSHTREHGGMGLGLAICRRLTTMMGGRLTLESVPGVGSLFRATLLVDKVREPGATPPRGFMEPALPTTHALEMLAYEPTALGRVHFEACAALLGHRGVAAGDYPSFSRDLGSQTWDLIFIHLDSKEPDAFALVQQIREGRFGAEHTGIYAVAIAEHHDLEHRARAQEAGFDDYLCKPLSRELLTDVLNTRQGDSNNSELFD